jgi:cytochrome P450
LVSAVDYHQIDDNLTDPAFFAGGDLHAVFKRLRHEDPVHWTQGRLTHGFWSITKYKDIQTVNLEPLVFSSQRGGSILPTSKETEEVGEAEKSRYGIELVNTDPPRHTQLRKLLESPFRQSAVRSLEATVREVVDELVESIASQRECDFVKEFAIRLPLQMICKVMGVPQEDWEKMRTWSDMALGQEDPAFQVEGGAFETKRQGFENIVKYCHELALQRRAAPRDDITSIIATSEVGGERLSDLELAWNTLILVVGGLETARNATAAGILALSQNPEQMEMLAANPALLPGAVDEILRWSSPALHNRRTATRDFELRGKKIREGDWVVLWLPSDNRDEDIFKDPYRFDITRSPNHHMAFGHGAHHCLGRHLARLEIRLALEGILQRNLRIDVTGPIEYVQSNLVAGIKRMPVRVREA